MRRPRRRQIGILIIRHEYITTNCSFCCSNWHIFKFLDVKCQFDVVTLSNEVISIKYYKLLELNLDFTISISLESSVNKVCYK